MLFRGKRVSSILGILPEKVALFDEEAGNYTFPVNQTLRLKRIMGFDRHRLAKRTTAVSDFAVRGLNHMLSQGWITKEEIGAVIVVTMCPDHFVPHISNIVQGECDLPHEVICLDIAQGCTGYVVGLMQAFLLLDHMEAGQKAVLINGDVLTHRISTQDRNEYPVMGDGAAISIVENTEQDAPVWLDLKMDGSRRDALIIPAGGFRMPSSPETAVMRDGGDGNIRSLDQMNMDGTAVMNFVLREIPPLLEELYAWAGQSQEETEYFLFHQPNRFMLDKLANRLKVDKSKMPMDLVAQTGNPSGASIPLVTALDLGDEMRQKTWRCCLCGFGTGLSFGAVLMDFGGFDHCEVIETDL